MDEAGTHTFEGLITADEAAKRLKVHRKTVVRRIEAGKLPGRKVGRDYLTHIDYITSPLLDGAPVAQEDAA